MINVVIIDGYLGSNPEVRKTQSGKSVCNASIAQTIKDKNGNQFTKWYRINAWERTADYLGGFCKKGDLILIEGHMDAHEYEQDGQKRISQDIVATKISMERYGQNHEQVQKQEPQVQQYTYQQNDQPAPQTYQQNLAYLQTTMAPQNMIPSEFNNGIDVNPDDLPF